MRVWAVIRPNGFQVKTKIKLKVSSNLGTFDFDLGSAQVPWSDQIFSSNPDFRADQFPGSGTSLKVDHHTKYHAKMNFRPLPHLEPNTFGENIPTSSNMLP